MVKILLIFMVLAFGLGNVIGYSSAKTSSARSLAKREYLRCKAELTTASIAQSALMDYLVDNQMITIFDAASARGFVDVSQRDASLECEKLDSNDN